MDDRIAIFLNLCKVSVSETIIQKLTDLKELLYQENLKYNLTRIKDEFEYWNKHVADSASIGLYFSQVIESSKTIADIGCGAGFPSIVLSIMYPNQIFTAIDSIGKKTTFVKMASEKLQLKNLEVITGRSNEIKLSKKFDFITARAVSEPVKIFRGTKHLLTQSGNYILYQTPARIETLKSEVETISSKYGFAWFLSEVFHLPGGETRIFLYSSRK
ncbi:MAG TPA: 16S rRNA (guanine(527)-N(7))-methyltransferase RsmG [Lentisphaeria bacterium]|nr:MAG: 16S rRNA (guanine(527)-N(7))-methyltransferase RsmG [Lentisphaerae bacterium GWF2_38_69]HBM15346.1 16S rRNA (guanine(527)-N(7))-methyltransferase RsmG [Lentisphaeria bacterium]